MLRWTVLVGHILAATFAVTFWADAPRELQDYALGIRSRFEAIEWEFETAFEAYSNDTSDDKARSVIIDLIQGQRPSHFAELVYHYVQDLKSMQGTEFQGVHATGVSNCEVALVTGSEIIYNIPHQSTLWDREHKFHDSLYALSLVMMHLLNDYTCLGEAQLYYNFTENQGNDETKFFLLSLAHHLDKANARYTDMVLLLHANDRDPSEPSEEFLFLDLQHTVDNMIRDFGQHLLDGLDHRDPLAIEQWGVKHGYPLQPPPELIYGEGGVTEKQRHVHDEEWSQFETVTRPVGEALVFRARHQLHDLDDEDLARKDMYDQMLLELEPFFPPEPEELRRPGHHWEL